METAAKCKLISLLLPRSRSHWSRSRLSSFRHCFILNIAWRKRQGYSLIRCSSICSRSHSYFAQSIPRQRDSHTVHKDTQDGFKSVQRARTRREGIPTRHRGSPAFVSETWSACNSELNANCRPMAGCGESHGDEARHPSLSRVRRPSYVALKPGRYY